MSSAYEKRYGMNFESMMQCDDSARFFASRPKRIVNEGVVSIIYSGAIASGRWESILDLCEAVSGLQKDGLNAEVSVYTSSFSTAREGGVAGLRVFPLPSHEELPAILKGADILFLPESFNKKYLSTTRLSISTKAHLYMMSERPILLYGPACIGVIDYAVKYGWGYVVKKRGKEFLKSAVREMIYNKRLCADIVENARKAVAVNHEASIVRESFRLAMIRAASVEVE
jgi:hypothetical protein